jgi:hypothetical protein
MSDFPRMFTLFGTQDIVLSRSHHPCCARNYIDLELCLETWEHPEPCDPHLFGRGGSRRYPGATCFQRKQLE